MKQHKLHIITKKLPGDIHTPVSMYLKLRDHFPKSVLLESNNFSNVRECHSIIGIDPIGSIQLRNKQLSFQFLNEIQHIELANPRELSDKIQEITQCIRIENEVNTQAFLGFLGHVNFEIVDYFDKINMEKTDEFDMPAMQYYFYRYVISFNHFEDSILITESIPEGERSQMNAWLPLLKKPIQSQQPFSLSAKEIANMSDLDFKQLVTKGKHSCQMGDVFQIVYSRRFGQGYIGDDFEVYRSLRSINPSPYLFYFDFGHYTIMGSSPESQLVIDKNQAVVHPIAGTFKRSGNDGLDKQMAQMLLDDPKENAEHTMLVDLARNDLGKQGKNVQVKELKKIKYYSHVIHMVSEVSADVDRHVNAFKMLGDTFPAGTLSGAPKIKALELINENEPTNRYAYGGGLGFLKLDGSLNHAIVIRSFLSINNTLYYQAGAGITIHSDEEKELQEVNHKLAALRKAIEITTQRTRS